MSRKQAARIICPWGNDRAGRAAFLSHAVTSGGECAAGVARTTLSGSGCRNAVRFSIHALWSKHISQKRDAARG